MTHKLTPMNLRHARYPSGAHWTALWLGIGLAMTVVASNSLAAEQTIVLRDYIKQAWSNELLSYPFSAPKGACLPESVTLTGPQGPLPAQLSEIEFWPDAKKKFRHHQ